MTDSQVKITLHYKGAKVGFFCDTPLDTDFPRKAAKGLSREITHKISDLCEQLAKRWHDAEENAGRQIAAAPEMYDVLVRIANEAAATWIRNVAKAVLAKIDGDIKERQRAKHYEDVTCDKSGCNGDRAEAHGTFAGGTAYKCVKCGHTWEEPCY
jgi:hypothetical protein